ncbi:hypothetical protein HNP55_004703 [Paucibacter oligotrophus]|uniref:MFS transporter n=1 Tax=Roseateles oligotrophus TaxID=1769250 RepID=A0A840LJI6_9BURK|nr:hypothetical protein [Roseateles oligotrophus]
MKGLDWRLVLVALYFGQGLPMGMALEAMPTALRAQGLPLAQLGWLSLALLPWVGKLLWARTVERLCGRWGFATVLLATQGLQLLASLALAWTPPAAGLHALLLPLLLMNLCAATQDNASNAWAALAQRQAGDSANAMRHGAGGLLVLGFVLGMVCGGGLLLQPLAAWGWLGLVLSLSGMQLLVLLMLCGMPRLQHQAGLQAQMLVPLRWRKLLADRRLWLLVALALLVRLGGSWQQYLFKPWLVDAGLGLARAGQIQLLLQLSTGLAAGLLAPLCLRRWGLRRVCTAVLPLSVLGLCLPWGLALAHGAQSASWQLWLYLLLGPGAWIDGLLMACATSCLLHWVAAQRPALEMACSQTGELVGGSLTMALAPWVLSQLGYAPSFALGALLALFAMPLLLGLGLRLPGAWPGASAGRAQGLAGVS